jgi:hypothetical protein
MISTGPMATEQIRQRGRNALGEPASDIVAADQLPARIFGRN